MENDSINVDFLYNISNANETTAIDNVTPFEIVAFSVMFFVVGLVGVTGNITVIYIVISDVKMRMSMTNILIVNLAVSDLCILLFGIPEIVQFMLNRGWLMGLEMCKIQRSVLVAALYTSVMTLLALCVERLVLLFIFILNISLPHVILCLETYMTIISILTVMCDVFRNQ